MSHINICEVGTRDGFQIEAEFIPTEYKIEVGNRLSETGAHLLVGGSLLRQLLQCLTGGFGRLKESLKSPVDPRQTQMS